MSWFFCLFFLFPFQAFAGFDSLRSVKDIEYCLEEDPEVLMVFDIDDTLTILGNPAFQRPNFKKEYPDVFAKIMAPLCEEEKVIAFTLPLLTTGGDLIEERAPLVINQLQERGIKMVALTAAMAGKIEGVCVEDRREAELKRVGIDFSGSFPEIPETVFFGFKKPLFGSSPLFKNGIIFTNENDKGQVLVCFLQLLSWRPKQIVFIDDRIEHLYAVERALSASYPEITFKGLHFLTDSASYKTVDIDTFRENWTELAEKSKKIFATEAA